MTPLLHARVSQAAEGSPASPAIVSADVTLTYEALETLSNRVAHMLLDAGCRRGDRVALLLPKSPETVAAMVGTLKAGCAYVPVDLASPPARAARMLAVADAAVVLVHPSATSLLDGVLQESGRPPAPAIGTVSAEQVVGSRFRTTFDGTTLAHLPASGPAVAPPRGSDAAHLLFTSGSTGDPKGVVVTHENVAAFLDWALPTFGIRSTDRLSSHPPLHFDLSTFDVFGALTAGATLHLVPPELNLVPHALARFIGDSALTQWFSVPSAMTLLASADAVPSEGWPALERVLFCGEVLPTPVLRHWMARLPNATFTNLYGPTEATIASSHHTFSSPPDDDTAPIPIGVPCAGEELLVLDAELAPVPQGAIGDLYIAGAGLSPGYWRDAQKTADAFLRDPRDPSRRLYRTGDLARVGDDGLLYFLGRVDSQIKSRGYRIELGEIEAAVNAIAVVRECGVVAVPSAGFEGTQIGCAYALARDRSASSRDLRRELARSLPRYMLPTRWLELEELPKNVNGKIDRPRLRELLAGTAPSPTSATTA